MTMGFDGAVSLNQLAKQIHAWARSNGFYDEGYLRDFDGHIALVHSEASEALEEWRRGYQINEHVIEEPNGMRHSFGNFPGSDDRDNYGIELENGCKPVGIPIEIADIIIRALDICAANNIDIESAIKYKMYYNAKRPYRNGNKRS